MDADFTPKKVGRLELRIDKGDQGRMLSLPMLEKKHNTGDTGGNLDCPTLYL